MRSPLPFIGVLSITLTALAADDAAPRSRPPAPEIPRVITNDDLPPVTPAGTVRFAPDRGESVDGREKNVLTERERARLDAAYARAEAAAFERARWREAQAAKERSAAVAAESASSAKSRTPTTGKSTKRSVSGKARSS